MQVVGESLRAAEQDIERVTVLGPDERLPVEDLALGRLEVGNRLGAVRARLVPHGDIACDEPPRLRRLLAGNGRHSEQTGDPNGKQDCRQDSFHVDLLIRQEYIKFGDDTWRKRGGFDKIIPA